MLYAEEGIRNVVCGRGHSKCCIRKRVFVMCYQCEEAVVKIFLPPFGCDLVRPPYVVIDSNLFSMTLSFYFREIL